MTVCFAVFKLALPRPLIRQVRNGAALLTNP